MKNSEKRNSMNGASILVSGAAGFIPSTLCEFYLAQGAKVIGLDNFITGQRDNLEKLYKFPHFEFIETDVSLKLPDFKNIDLNYVYSLASPASPKDFQTIPLEIMKVNSLGTLNLLNLAVEKQARFLEASTSEVYGDPEVHPQVESYFGNVNPIGPRSCYDESKRFSEAMTMVFHKQFGLSTRIVRIFNTYGPGMRKDDGRVIPNFITQALEGADLTIYGDGTQTRSFCYVDDLVQAIHGVMMGDDVTPVNIGNPDEKRIVDVAQLIINLTQSKSKICFLPLTQDDPTRRKPNIEKLKRICHFSPVVSLEEGLLKTIHYFSQR